MKQKLTIIASIFILAIGLVPIARSQWVATKGPTGQYYSLSYVTSFAQKGENLYASCRAHGRVFRTTDYGNNWTLVGTGLASDSVYALGSNGKDLFAGSWDGVSRLNDNDSTWTRVDSNFHGVWYVHTLLVNDSNVFISLAGRGVFLSTNSGTTWTAKNNGLTDTTSVRALVQSGSNLFAGTLRGVFLSTDNGVNWKAVNNGLSDTIVYALAVSGKNLFAATGTGGIFLSTNNGTNWMSVNNGMTTNNIYSFAFAVIGTNIFAGGYPGGVFLSTNNGTNWKDITDNLSGSFLESLFISGPYIFAGVNTAYRRPLSDFGIAEVKNPTQINLNISLSPNPTTGIITVHNTSANILHVTVSSILGESVLELEHPNAPDFSLDLSKLPLGTYFARFVMAGEVVTKKIIKE